MLFKVLFKYFEVVFDHEALFTVSEVHCCVLRSKYFHIKNLPMISMVHVCVYVYVVWCSVV